MQDNKDFSDFLLSEYDHISNAHFEMTKQVSLFLRYYLLIMSAPAFIFTIYGKDVDSLRKILTGQDFGISNYIAYFCLLISIIGLLVCMYMIKLKHNGILYARTVNGIRNYFYSQKNLGEAQSTVIVLPIITSKPKYFNTSFLPIVTIFALIDSFYFYLFFLIKALSYDLVYSCAFFLLHIFSYMLISFLREKKH